MRKLLLTIAVTAICSGSAFADALFLTVPATPYDSQMARIRPVLTAPAHGESDLTLATVNEWMKHLRAIPYGYQMFWKTPAETEAGGPADCKAKAVALYEKMREHGATNVRLVIGKRTAMSTKTHAWLAWESPEGSFMLDPTFFYAAKPAQKVGKRDYKPLFAYSGSRKYRAASNLVAAN